MGLVGHKGSPSTASDALSFLQDQPGIKTRLSQGSTARKLILSIQYYVQLFGYIERDSLVARAVVGKSLTVYCKQEPFLSMKGRHFFPEQEILVAALAISLLRAPGLRENVLDAVLISYDIRRQSEDSITTARAVILLISCF